MMPAEEIRQWIASLKEERGLWTAKLQRPAPFPFTERDQRQIVGFQTTRIDIIVRTLRTVLGEEEGES